VAPAFRRRQHLVAWAGTLPVKGSIACVGIPRSWIRPVGPTLQRAGRTRAHRFVGRAFHTNSAIALSQPTNSRAMVCTFSLSGPGFGAPVVACRDDRDHVHQAGGPSGDRNARNGGRPQPELCTAHAISARVRAAPCIETRTSLKSSLRLPRDCLADRRVDASGTDDGVCRDARAAPALSSNVIGRARSSCSNADAAVSPGEAVAPGRAGGAAKREHVCAVRDLSLLRRTGLATSPSVARTSPPFLPRRFPGWLPPAPRRAPFPLLPAARNRPHHVRRDHDPGAASPQLSACS